MTNVCPRCGFTEHKEATMFAAALDVLASRRPPARFNPAKYHETVLNGLTRQYARRLWRVDWTRTWTPEELADWLEPPAQPHPLETTGRAQAKIIELNEARRANA